MGTKGLYAFRYRGLYFTKYSYTDSYPSVLGRRLVNDIPADPAKFQEWMQATRTHLESEYQALSQHEYDYCSSGYAYKPSPSPPENDACIEWVYTIDLDRIAFSVDNGAHFRLDNIPRGIAEDNTEWVEYLALDGRGWRCLRPSTPHHIVADLHPVDTDTGAPSAEGLALYDVLQPIRISSSVWSGRVPTSELAMQGVTTMLFRTLLNQYYGRLSDVYQYPPTHPKFQGPAEFLLRAAAPGFLSLTFQERDEPRHQNVSVEESADICPDRSTESTYFWFRGCLIHLSSRLDSEAHLRAAVGDTIRRVRQRGLEKCTALLWSLRHVVVVTVHVGGDREVEVAHSAAIPVLAAYGVDDAALESAIRLFAHYLAPKLVSDGGERDDVGDREETLTPVQMVGTEHLVPVPVVERTGTYEVMVDDIVNDKRVRPRVPFDVVAEIMFYADTPTYNAFRRVSRASRALWARRPRLGPYTVLFVPPPPPASDHPGPQQPTVALAAHDALGRPVRLRLAYRGRCAEPDADKYALYYANANAIEKCDSAKALPMVLDLPAGVRCGAVMAELVRGVRHAVYVSQSERRGCDEAL